MEPNNHSERVIEQSQKEVSTSSKKPKFLFIILGIVILCFLISAYLIGTKNSFSKVATTSKSSPTLSPIPMAWKTYINKEYNFSFEYPKSWLLGEDQDKNSKVRGIPFIYLRPESQKVSDPTHGEVTVWLYKDMQPNYYIENKLCDSPGVCASLKNTEKVYVSNLGNIEALRVKNIPGPLPSEEIIITNGNQMIVFHFNYQGKTYTDFTNKDSKKVFDWILSTFKFSTSSNINSNSQFQQILKKYCKPMIGTNIKVRVPYLFTINESVLPVNFNDVMKYYMKDSGFFDCISASPDSMQNGYASYFGIQVWEDASKQGTLFGEPLIIDSVPLVSKNPDVELSAFLLTAYYDQKNVMVRGKRTLVSKNGEKIYVSDDRALMSIEDPRIVKLQEEYRINNPHVSSEVTIQSVYSIFRVLQQKELDIIDKLIDDLNTVTLKN